MLPGHTPATILCCLCGTQIQPNDANMCAQCLRTKYDLARSITTEVTLHQCRGCQRWNRPPFVAAERETNELMAICLSRIHGLNTVKVRETSWIWCEEHSRRLKVKLTVEAQVEAGVTLQQQIPVTFIIRNQQCPDCNSQYTGGAWKCVVQVRQRAPHPRSLLYLEQLILKHGAHDKALSIDRLTGGLDFYFQDRSHGARFADLVCSVLPCKQKHSTKLISADNHSNTANQKFTTIVEIPLISKNDLVVLPRKLAAQCGQISQLVLVTSVQSSIFVVDPFTLQRATITAEKYWRQPFLPLLASDSRSLIEFMVLDAEPSDRTRAANADRRMRLVDLEIARARDLGTNDTTLNVTCHLGHLLSPGDACKGFDLTSANFTESAMEELRGGEAALPEIVLVRKHYPKRPKGKRQWKLRSLDAAHIETQRAAEITREEQAYESFMREVEDDAELRGTINLYRDPSVLPPPAPGAEGGAAAAGADADMSDTESVDGEAPPAIALEELLDEMTVSQRPAGAGQGDDDDEAFEDEEELERRAAEFALRSAASAPAGVTVNAAGVAFFTPAPAAPAPDSEL